MHKGGTLSDNYVSSTYQVRRITIKKPTRFVTDSIFCASLSPESAVMRVHVVYRFSTTNFLYPPFRPAGELFLRQVVAHELLTSNTIVPSRTSRTVGKQLAQIWICYVDVQLERRRGSNIIITNKLWYDLPLISWLTCEQIMSLYALSSS